MKTDEDRLYEWLGRCEEIYRVSNHDWNLLKRVLRDVRQDARFEMVKLRATDPRRSVERKS